MGIQRACWAGKTGNLVIMGPSIVAGMPHPEGWITDDSANIWMSATPRCMRATDIITRLRIPTFPAPAGSVNDYVGGLAMAYAGHAIHLTEYHPTLFNNEGHKPDQPGWDGERDACYTLTTLLRCGKEAIGLWWYALFDYGDAYRCGLFPISGGNDPRPAKRTRSRRCAPSAPTVATGTASHPARSTSRSPAPRPRWTMTCIRPVMERFLCPSGIRRRMSAYSGED